MFLLPLPRQLVGQIYYISIYNNKYLLFYMYTYKKNMYILFIVCPAYPNSFDHFDHI